MCSVISGLCLSLFVSCVPATDPGGQDSATADDQTAVSGSDVVIDVRSGGWELDDQDDMPDPSIAEPVGACCIGGACFEELTRGTCESNGGNWLGERSTCASCVSNAEVIAVLKSLDTDNDGRSDYDELATGNDPRDPTDGPDIDGDGVPNGEDLDVDGDRIPNAYDRDIDNDSIINDLDNDRDGDFLANSEDNDDDGDGVDDDDDDDDDADGDDDDDEDDSAPGNSGADPDDDFDLLALARRLFDDEADEVGPEQADLVGVADQLLDEAQEDPDDFDPAEFAREFFESVNEAIEEEETLAFFRRMFDEDGDGVLDVKDRDPDGDGNSDSDGDGLGDLQELRIGTDPHDADTDDDGLSDGDEVARGTDPRDSDSDDDGIPDGDDTP